MTAAQQAEAMARLKVIQAELTIIQQILANPVEKTKVGQLMPNRHQTTRRKRATVSYRVFRKLFQRGELAQLYTLNHAEIVSGRTVVVITESDVQQAWRNAGKVPSAAYQYALDKIETLREMAQRPRVRWTREMDQFMIRTMQTFAGKAYAAVGHEMTRQFGQVISANSIKGRFENTLPKKQDQVLISTHGLTPIEIQFVKAKA